MAESKQLALLALEPFGRQPAVICHLLNEESESVARRGARLILPLFADSLALVIEELFCRHLTRSEYDALDSTPSASGDWFGKARIVGHCSLAISKLVSRRNRRERANRTPVPVSTKDGGSHQDILCRLFGV